MTRSNWIVVALAYILGLFLTNLVGDFVANFSQLQLFVLLAVSMGWAVISAIALTRSSRKNLIWVVALAVAISAVAYFQLRLPQPKYNDISYQVAQDERLLVRVTGKVLNEPRLNAKQRLKFWFAAREIEGESTSGKLYATLPLLQGTGIYPGQDLQLTGLLYLPQPAIASSGFDFQQYLADRGSFAGIQGTAASFATSKPKWGWWQLRQRIVRSHLQGLGSPTGQLVSSMVLGRKAVDLPSQIRDRFINAGLAHVLAASGFHVSLLLGMMLRLTSRLAAKPRLALGIGTLTIYLGLTGVQASVLRACLMGVAVLIALTLETKVKPLGSLLLAAVIILLFNPLLINDLGFQLSFLATFGLITTLPTLQEKLDWLPKAIAVLVAIPLAASVWVLPLLCYKFNTIATYGILVNILCTPLITIVSLGGMVSGMVALMMPALGSAIAAGLYYPATWLMGIVNFFTSLPGSTWAVGQIPLAVLLAIYGLFMLVWRSRWWQKRWWLGIILPSTLLTAIAINNLWQVQIAVLPNSQSPIVVIRDRGTVITINSGSLDRSQYTLLPFLAQQGINYIDHGIALGKRSNSAAAWRTICSKVGIGSIYETVTSDNLFEVKIVSSPLEREIKTKSIRLNVDKELSIAKLQTVNHTWLILGHGKTNTSTIDRYIAQHNLKAQNLILVWSGNIAPAWLKQLSPQMAIVFNNKIDSKTNKLLRQKQIKFHNMATSGMMRWTAKQGFLTEEKQPI